MNRSSSYTDHIYRLSGFTPMVDHELNILLRMIYPDGPNRSLSSRKGQNGQPRYHLKKGLSVDITYHESRTQLASFLGTPLRKAEKTRYEECKDNIVMLQVIKHDEKCVAVMGWAWSPIETFDFYDDKDDYLDTSAPVQPVLRFYFRRGASDASDSSILSKAMQYLPYQWLEFYGCKAVEPLALINKEESSKLIDAGWLYLGPKKDTNDELLAFGYDKATYPSKDIWNDEEPRCMPFPIKYNLFPSLECLFKSLDTSQIKLRSYTFESLLLTTFIAATLKGKTATCVMSLMNRLSILHAGCLGIHYSTDSAHLEQDLKTLCETLHIPTTLALVEDWMKQHKAELLSSLHPETSEAKKILLNFARIIHGAGAKL